MSLEADLTAASAKERSLTAALSEAAVREQSLLRSIADVTMREQGLAGSLRESNARLAAITVEVNELKRALDQAGIAAPPVHHFSAPAPEAFSPHPPSPVSDIGAAGDTRFPPDVSGGKSLPESALMSKKQDLAGDLKVAGSRALAAATAVAGAASTVAGALVTVGRFIGKKARLVLTFACS